MCVGQGQKVGGIRAKSGYQRHHPPLAVPSVGRSSMGQAEVLQGLGEVVQQVPEDQSPGCCV